MVSSAKLVPCDIGKKGTVLPESKLSACMSKNEQTYRKVNPRWQHNFITKLILTPWACYAVLAGCRASAGWV